jgi:hypothetical protein
MPELDIIRFYQLKILLCTFFFKKISLCVMGSLSITLLSTTRLTLKPYITRFFGISTNVIQCQ